MVPSSVRYQPEIRAERQTPFLVTDYFPGIFAVAGILRELQNILLSSHLTRDVFPLPFSLSFRGSHNLGNKLSHKVLPRGREPWSQSKLGPCGRPRCKLCIMVCTDPVFSSANTEFQYQCRGPPTNCQSRNVVYLMECKHCRAFYVGKTTNQLNIRMNAHRSAARRRLEEPVSLHAASHEIVDLAACFTVKVLRALPEDSTDVEVRLSEQAHQWILGAHRLPGLNVNR